jgi:23S rRNA (cytosine1962-C5)-methyltransferase
MSDDPASRPSITIEAGRQKRLLGGHPWVYSNEVRMDAAAKALPRGSLVTLLAADGKALGVATFNPNTLIAARVIDRDARRAIDADFFRARIERALVLRQKLYGEPYYRLIHAEADGLPGIVCDRFGSVLVAQLNTAGTARLEAEWVAACQAVLAPAAILVRADSTAQATEGLEDTARLVAGNLPDPVEIHENGARYLIDAQAGQKTGWFYDQRDNRRFMAGLAAGARVLDLYCFGGGFAIAAALAGAADVTGIDRSEAALALATASAELNQVAARCRFTRGEGFAEMTRLHEARERFDMVIADPPAFVKSKKDLAPGLRGYRKLARLAAALVAPEGLLFLASCSHNVTVEDFTEAVRHGLQDAERSGRILRQAGASPDHPMHLALPESAYLKSLVLALD